jgi:hypothetical protein
MTRLTETIVFTGRFHPEHFAAFVDHRARRLDLEASLEEAGAATISVRVAGHPDLIDAFEMACSLGPIDCLVLEVHRGGAR